MRGSSLRGLAFIAWATAIFAASGCGKPSNLAPLSGTVSYKGKPLEFGSVMLMPAQGGLASRADIEANGSFTLQTVDGQEGATIGLNRIRVACVPAQKPGANSSPGGEVSLGKSLIPQHYNNFSSSGLSVEVLPENNPPLVIELKD
jgi:hypothetical protein